MRRVAARCFPSRMVLCAATPLMQRAFQSGGTRGPQGGQQPPEVGSFRGQPQQPPRQQMEQEAPPPPTRPPGEPKFFKSDLNQNGVLTLKMSRAPVNSLSLDMFEEINTWLLWYGYDETVKAIVLTSDIPMVFSAGLDITELHDPKVERFTEFWRNFQEIWMILNTFPKPVIAAINGNSPAGGCVLSICCDYRVMARAPASAPDRLYRIGLNETKLGIVAPPWVMSSYSYILGTRKAERMLQLGETPTADEALALGLVDAVVSEEECIATAVKEAEKLLKIPSEARWMSKDMMRRELFRFMGTDEERQYDTEFFTKMIKTPEVVQSIGNYLSRLGSKKK